MAKKKVLLSSMPSEGEFVNWTVLKFFHPQRVRYMPLGILSLASNLPPDYDVKILDPPSEGWTIKETIDKIESEKPDILGLSAVTRRVYALNKILENTSAPYKAVGGPHATYYSNQILQRGADAVFRGPLADLEFAEAVEKMPKGVIECRTKINDIKFPRRDFLDVNKYFPQDFVLFKAEKRLPMFSSIGCPNKCIFCNVQSKKLQLKSPQTVIDEMQYLISIGCGSVHMLDDNFNISSNHLEGILNEMESRKMSVEWSGRGQVRMNLNLAGRMAEKGFKRIHVGIESVFDDELKFFNKSETVRDVYKFCEAMNKSNIDILAYFILGSPVETDAHREKLPKIIKELGIKHPFFNVLFPEPDTPYYASLLQDGHYKEDFWAKYMENPVPNYEIPYPYRESRKKEILEYADKMVNEFKKKVV